MTLCKNQRWRIGLKDAAGRDIREGDLVEYRNAGKYTKREYWNPVYEIVWRPPSFVLKHVGGGKSGDGLDFKLRCGGGNGDLFIIGRMKKMESER